MSKKLVKSTSNAVFSGVCSGIAKYFNIDPTIIRLGFVVSFFFGLGSPGLIYLVMAFVMPKDDTYFY
ncbi:PspC domain-containing protein [Flammeovirga kamogawensis]|uniref:PspC domain-containing protein n=1 Tax=Flammeovirga kamogawensis TaxID=373891 RepID=A0ABX8GT13_9BACT|nr:PspC domain-containing protein [Flammeovirga kamogawensis]MBB6463006.1 phage shock protein C [Flammeovirga kamogawensis]QWG06531.1 PspC domain-containing protein [Flammeovirga kamogawensis]TRX68359.1 PspC domain-containing protein [Flammeovirga kamogawensis]